jgi:predicted branched-subunit amino acid permease
MSLLVYAGSAQLAALPLIAGDFPLWTIFVTAIIVNLRFIIFSAGIQPYFKNRSFWKRSVLGYLNGDLNFALFMSKFPRHQKDPSHLPFFLGMSLTNWSIWQIGSLVGIFLAGAVPDSWGLGFAGTLALIAILLPMLDHLSARLAALSALLVALLANDLPYKLSIVLAVIVAILVGIMCDRFTKKERSAV